MNRYCPRIRTTVLLLLLTLVLLAGDAVAQQQSLKEQLVGTWIYVSQGVGC